jgi:predicted nucleic acid-binding protein
VILVDTSVWVDHLHVPDPYLAGLLDQNMVLAHPFVIGEIALGHLRQREVILTALSRLPRASVASDAEVMQFIESEHLFGRGIGYVDAHLLAAVRLTPGSVLWTNDKRLYDVTQELGLAIGSLKHRF